MTGSSGPYGPINKTTFCETKATAPSSAACPTWQSSARTRRHAGHVAGGIRRSYGQATKAAIMRKDVVGKNRPSPRCEPPKKGCWSRSTSAAGRSAVHRQALRKARGAGHRRTGRPDLPRSGDRNWQTADAYLSGNVRAKLAAAEQPARITRRNAEAHCSRAARGRVARRHRCQSRRAVDSGQRHPGVRSRPLPRRSRPSIQVGAPARRTRCGASKPTTRPRRRSPRPPNTAPRAERRSGSSSGPQHENARRSTTRSQPATVKSASSTRRKRSPLGRSRS